MTVPEGAPEYTIRGGRTDADRLARQAGVMAVATGTLLREIGVGAGWACLDVGCGDGQVTADLARLVGPSGRVVGVDIDDQALELARQATAGSGATVSFVRGDIRELDIRTSDFGHADVRATDVGAVDIRQGEGGGQFDLAYARLVLSHLTDPATALRSMCSALRPGGVAAVEDLFTGTLRSDPPEPALDRLQEVYSATVRHHGGDPTIGPRLVALLTASGFEDVREHTVTNPMTTVESKLFLVELLDNMRPAILDAGAANARQLSEIKAGVEQAARDRGLVFYQARIHQVWGRRPR